MVSDTLTFRLPGAVATKRAAFRSRWWRTCIAWCALIALAWTSLGPLPYVVHEHLDIAGAHAHSGHRHADASSIPGGPTHPDDHHCPECEVLKHLARCVFALPTPAVLAPVVVGFFARRVVVATPSSPNPVHVPPARAPPAPA